MGSEVCSLEYVTDYNPEESPVTDIVVSKGSVSNNNTGEEGSGLGDVGNEVFADVDERCLRRCYCNKTISREKRTVRE